MLRDVNFRMWMECRDRARRTRAGSVVHSMKGRAGRCHGQADGVGVDAELLGNGPWDEAVDAGRSRAGEGDTKEGVR